MPLFHVEIDLELYVVADSQDEAERIAERHLHEEAHSACYWASEPVTKEENVPGDWIDCLPYGAKRSGKTVRQILAEQAEAERTRPPTLAEIEAAGQVRLIP